MRFRELTGSALLSAGLFAVAYSRAPYVLTAGRFWAEEGNAFFPAIRDASPRLLGIFYYLPEAGFVALTTNIVVLFSTLVPLSIAPLVTAWLSVAVVVGISILLHRALITHPRCGNDRAMRALAYIAPIVLLVGPVGYPEAWANSINLHHYLAVLSFLLVAAYPAFETRGGAARTVAPFVLGASSPYSALIGLLDWWRPKGVPIGRQRRAALSATAGFLVQVLGFARSYQGNVVTPQRRFIVRPSQVLENAAFALSSTVAGQDTMLAVIGPIERSSALTDGSTGPFALTFMLVTLLSTAGFAVLLLASDRRLAVLTLLSFVAVIALVSFAAFQGVGRGRYGIAPVGILVTATFLIIYGPRITGVALKKRVEIVGGAFVALFALAGATEFWTLERGSFLDCRECPDWVGQVSEWDQSVGEEVIIRIWPQPQWSMTLKPRS